MQIVADVLEVAKDGARKTRIMFGANLSYELLELYLATLVQEDLLEQSDKKGIYRISRKGSIFLKEFSEFRKLQSLYGDKIVSLKRLLLAK